MNVLIAVKKNEHREIIAAGSISKGFTTVQFETISNWHEMLSFLRPSICVVDDANCRANKSAALSALAQYRNQSNVIILKANEISAEDSDLGFCFDGQFKLPCREEVAASALISVVNSILVETSMQASRSFPMAELKYVDHMKVGDKVIELTSTELRILRLLMKHSDEVVNRQNILDLLPMNSRAPDVHICNLRRKLGASAARIHTIRGRGYMFVTSMSAPQVSVFSVLNEP